MKKRVLSLLLALLMVVSLLPFAASAADTGKVRVIVENTTLRSETVTVSDQTVAVPWHDLLFDTQIAWSDGMTMEAAMIAAAEAEKAEMDITESSYGSYLAGVAGLDASQGGGWMTSLNDWFCDAGISDVTVEPGDTVRVVYTMDWGADVGGDWSSTDVGLRDLSFSYGSLYPAFSHDVTDYTLYLPAGVSSVLVTPTAANKNNKVFVTAGDEDASRWGAREVSSSDKTVTVKVDGGTAYTVKLVPAKPVFVDVPAGEYYTEPVNWAVEKGVTNGVDDTHFAPMENCTRGQIVTFLWRAAGSPEPQSANNPFVDVHEGDYYCKAVLWAAETGVTNGVDAKHFAPGSSCTRAQAVTFLWRAENKPEPKAQTSDFSDVKNPDAYYYKAVLWAVETGVTNGTGGGKFSPDDVCTRGQIVTFLYRAMTGAAASALAVENPLEAALSYMISNVSEPACATGDWAALTVARNAAATGFTLPAGYLNYYATVEAKAKETDGKMDAKYATDYARIALAVTAMGYNAADVAGYDLTEKLSDVAYVNTQGVNGAIYALLALDSGDYASYARPDLVQAVLDAQLSDGGWTYMDGDPADPDLTAMALQALTPYLGDSAVNAAVKSGLQCLSGLQREDGGFFSWGASSSESTAQALIAALALQAQTIDADIAESVPGLFEKSDGTAANTLQSNLRSFQLDDGSFCHTKEDGTTNGYAMNQCLCALVAEQCADLGVTLYVVR